MSLSTSSPGSTRSDSASVFIDLRDDGKVCFSPQQLRSPASSQTRSPVGSLRSPGDFEVETDPGTIARRNKQVEYGKSTTEYTNYIQAVPRGERADFHPKTPNVRRKYSRRAWDGLIKQWRLNLHVWSDSPEPEIDLTQNGMIRKRRNNSSSSSASNSTSASSSNLVGESEEKDCSRSASAPRGNKMSKKSACSDIFSTSWADEVENYEFKELE